MASSKFVKLATEKVKNKISDLYVWKQTLLDEIDAIVKSADEAGAAFFAISGRDRHAFLASCTATNATIEACTCKLMSAINYINSDTQNDDCCDEDENQSVSWDTESESASLCLSRSVSTKRRVHSPEQSSPQQNLHRQNASGSPHHHQANMSFECFSSGIDGNCSSFQPRGRSSLIEETPESGRAASSQSDSTLCAVSSTPSLNVSSQSLGLVETEIPAAGHQDSSIVSLDTSVSKLNVNCREFTPQRSLPSMQASCLATSSESTNIMPNYINATDASTVAVISDPVVTQSVLELVGITPTVPVPFGGKADSQLPSFNAAVATQHLPVFGAAPAAQIPNGFAGASAQSQPLFSGSPGVVQAVVGNPCTTSQAQLIVGSPGTTSQAQPIVGNACTTSQARQIIGGSVTTSQTQPVFGGYSTTSPDKQLFGGHVATSQNHQTFGSQVITSQALIGGVTPVFTTTTQSRIQSVHAAPLDVTGYPGFTSAVPTCHAPPFAAFQSPPTTFHLPGNTVATFSHPHLFGGSVTPACYTTGAPLHVQPVTVVTLPPGPYQQQSFLYGSPGHITQPPASMTWNAQNSNSFPMFPVTRTMSVPANISQPFLRKYSRGVGISPPLNPDPMPSLLPGNASPVDSASGFSVKSSVGGSVVPTLAAVAVTDNVRLGSTMGISQPLRTVPAGRLQVGMVYMGMMTHLDNPSSFCLQVVFTSDNEIDALNEQMNQFYIGKKLSTPIVEAKVNMLCALTLPTDEDDDSVDADDGDVTWKRGIITNVHHLADRSDIRMATVRLLDFGFSTEVPVAKLMQLDDKFAARSCLAISCAFRGVKPCGGSEWSAAAIEGFERLVKYKLLNFVVASISESGRHLVDFLRSPSNEEKFINSDVICTTLVISRCAEYDTPRPVTPSPAVTPDHNTSENRKRCRSSDEADDADADVSTDVGSTSAAVAQDSMLPSRTKEDAPVGVAEKPGLLDQATDLRSPIRSDPITDLRGHRSPPPMPAPAVLSKVVPNIQLDISVISDCLAESELNDTYDASSEETEFEPVTAPATAWNTAKNRRRRRRQGTRNSETTTEAAHTDLEVVPATPEKTSGSTSKPGGANGTVGRWMIPDSSETIQANELMQVIMSRVWTPDEFYVNPVTEEASTIDLFATKLNKTYERSIVPLAFGEYTDISIGSFWCARYPEDNRWYRAKVLDVKSEACTVSPTDLLTGKPADTQKKKKGKKSKGAESYFRKWLVYVLYIDYGDKAWITSCELRMLKDEFCKMPAFAIQCSMALVSPKPSGALEPAQWSEEAGVKLREMTGTSPFTIQRLEPDKKNPISVLLWDLSGDSSKILNEDFVTSGLAVSIQFKVKNDLSGSSSSADTEEPVTAPPPPTTNSVVPEPCPKENRTSGVCDTDEERRLAEWDPMAEDYNSLANSYNVDVDDPGVALTGYKARDEMDICAFYQRGQKCPRGLACPYKHIKPLADGTTTDQKKIWTNKEPLELPHIGQLVHIEVNAIYSPENFYANFPVSGKQIVDLGVASNNRCDRADQDLNTFQEELQKYYKTRSRRHGDFLLRSKGEIVVAKFSEDGLWYRGRVIDVQREKCEVFMFFVDYGNSEWVLEADIHDIDPRFIHLPYQSVECFLVRIVKHEKDKKWKKEATAFFFRLIRDKPLVARVICMEGERLGIDLFTVASNSKVDVSRALVNAQLADVRRSASGVKSIGCGGSQKSGVIWPA